MKNASIVILVLMLNVCMASSEGAELFWEKIKEENNVIVYCQEIEGADLVMVKTEVVIDANMQLIKSILNDVTNRKNWIPYLSESRILAEYAIEEKLEYAFFTAPWPASDRDFVYRQRILQNNDKKIVFVMQSEESGLMPLKDGVVRAEMMKSQYTLTTLGDKKTKVELIFYIDLKGWLPDWIINKIQQVLPYITLRNLKVKAEGLVKEKGVPKVREIYD